MSETYTSIEAVQELSLVTSPLVDLTCQERIQKQVDLTIYSIICKEKQHPKCFNRRERLSEIVIWLFQTIFFCRSICLGKRGKFDNMTFFLYDIIRNQVLYNMK